MWFIDDPPPAKNAVHRSSIGNRAREQRVEIAVAVLVDDDGHTDLALTGEVGLPDVLKRGFLSEEWIGHGHVSNATTLTLQRNR